MKQRVNRVSVQCGTVVAKNNQLHAAHPTVQCTCTCIDYLLHGLGPTVLHFFSIFITSSHSFITIVFGRKWMCHKQTHIHDFSLLPILFCTLCTYIVYIHSLSLVVVVSGEMGGGIFLPFLVVMTFTIFYYYCHTTQNYLPHYYTTVS